LWFKFPICKAVRKFTASGEDPWKEKQKIATQDKEAENVNSVHSDV
jgi:hypothetical protein